VCRPITCTTITRWWASAVECSRPIASVATSTAVWKPKVTSVARRSLSIVFGTPITGSPFLYSACAMFSEPSPPIAISASISSSRKRSTISPGAVHRAPGAVRPAHLQPERVPARGGAQDGAAQVGDAAHRLLGEREEARLAVHLALQQAGVAAADPEHLPAAR
jgi:hypothetical protein